LQLRKKIFKPRETNLALHLFSQELFVFTCPEVCSISRTRESSSSEKKFFENFFLPEFKSQNKNLQQKSESFQKRRKKELSLHLINGCLDFGHHFYSEKIRLLLLL